MSALVLLFQKTVREVNTSCLDKVMSRINPISNATQISSIRTVSMKNPSSWCNAKIQEGFSMLGSFNL